jgi:hypothetical protein
MKLASSSLSFNCFLLHGKSTDLPFGRFEPSRIDRHHRRYCRLQPSHRLSELEFRRFCLVLPFGAANNNFSTPNKFLFSPKGEWLQDDLASPLGSWKYVRGLFFSRARAFIFKTCSIEDVVKAGKAHGAQSVDLYGCLYFYLSDQLRMFADRLSKFRISFCIFDRDARDLAKDLRAGELISHGPLRTYDSTVSMFRISLIRSMWEYRMFSRIGPRF